MKVKIENIHDKSLLVEWGEDSWYKTNCKQIDPHEACVVEVDNPSVELEIKEEFQ